MTMSRAQVLNVGFAGYYGMRNFGDDLFGALCVLAGREFWKCEPKLVAPSIPGVRASYTMPRVYPRRLYGSDGRIGQVSRLWSVLDGIVTSDVLVLGGGSLITSRVSPGLALMGRARDRGWIRLAGVGISVGPFNSAKAERSAAELLARFEYIATRDRRSYELAAAMGLGSRLCEGRDLAGLLPALAWNGVAPARAGNENARARVGIALCNYGADRDSRAVHIEALTEALAGALARLAHHRSLEVVIFSLNDHPIHGDLVLTRRLEAMLSKAGIAAKMHLYRGADPLHTAACIAACDAVISARLHGAIVAYIQGVPFALVEYHSKCRDFAADIGLVEARLIKRDNCSASDLEDVLVGMLAGRDSPALRPCEYSRQAVMAFRSAPWGAE